MLHKKELVLNREQTQDILQAVSLIDKARNQVGNIASQIRETNRYNEFAGNSTSFGDINLYFEKFKGTEQDAEKVSKAILDKLKKRR